MGFQQAEANTCLFISPDVICLHYIDNNLYFFKDNNAMERLKKAMEAESIMFREEESVAGYLGVHIDCKDDGSILLTQSGLTEKIVGAMHLLDKSIKSINTPCANCLPIDKDGKVSHGDFNYQSVIGQLNYLQGHSRPDITLATFPIMAQAQEH